MTHTGAKERIWAVKLAEYGTAQILQAFQLTALVGPLLYAVVYFEEGPNANPTIPCA